MNNENEWDTRLSQKYLGYISQYCYGMKENFSKEIPKFSPCNSKYIAHVKVPTIKYIDYALQENRAAYKQWRSVPAPRRGAVIKQFSQVLEREKEELARLITIETGKTITESLGEVQEMIDICDYAVGLSRQLTGLTIASERKEHKLLETWHPLGQVLVVSAFNFPAAVWAWNFAIAIVCGNSVIWKPSEKTPVTAIVCNALFNEISPIKNLSTLIIGEKEESEYLVNNRNIALVSATGSTEMGYSVGVAVQKRFGKLLLELGGNNAGIVTPSADLKSAIPSIAFGAAGTTGQRCTTLRRLFVHSSIYGETVAKLCEFYRDVIFEKIGNPLSPNTLIGPLIDTHAWTAMEQAIAGATSPSEGGKLLMGGCRLRQLSNAPEASRVQTGNVGSDFSAWVQPTIIKMPKQTKTVLKETFAPILYVMKYDYLEDAINEINLSSQGLSSCIFTTDMRESEFFLSERGSDCGIANVNIGTSGAEIGGAFGGEKETGGGRESGSDSWKNYMRRQTATINYSYSAPELAQGVKFD